jgi:metal-responsive CopG/Arc/MetJ family transcriptional regulator
MAKVLVSIDEALLRRIDRVARARGLSRSAYLAEIAHRDVARSLGPGKTSQARRALSRLDTLIGASLAGESTVLVRAERDAR